MKKRILIVCGSGIATSTVVAGKVRDLLNKHGIEHEIAQISAAELRSRIAGIDLVVSTTATPRDLSVPVVSALPYITGVGADRLDAEILANLQSTS